MVTVSLPGVLVPFLVTLDVGSFAGAIACSDPTNGAYNTDISSGAGSGRVAIVSKHSVAALIGGDVITCTYPGFSGASHISANEFSGLAPSSTLDKTAQDADSVTGAISSGLTASTTLADELLFGFVNMGVISQTFTPSAGWSVIGSIATQKPMYKLVFATGQYEADGTLSGSGAWKSQIATYRVQPTVTSVSPTSGPAAGGNTVTINGTALSGTTAVSFNGTPGTGISILNSTEITVTAPAHVAGTVDVTVTTGASPNPTLTSATSSADQYTFIGPADPANSSISGTSPVTADGVAASTITITLKDSANNSIVGVTPTFAATGSNNTLGPCSASDAAGVSTCSLASTKAEVKTLSIVSPVSKTGGAVTFQAGPAAAGNSSISGTSPVAADGVAASTISITLADASGNPVSGVTPTFVATGSNNTLGPCSATDAGGASTCSLKSTTAETKTLSITSPVSKTGGTVQFTSSAPLYSFTGFFPPIDNLPVYNIVKAGQASPVKFSLPGNQGLDIFAAGYPTSGTIACISTALDDFIEQTATAGNSSLSYDPGADQYVYVWKTDKAWANTCRQLVVKLKDGSYHRANFKFTR